LPSIAQVKCQCAIVVEILMTKLEKHFLDSKLMNAPGILYPQIWMQPNVEFSFSLDLIVIKKQYCELKRMKLSIYQVV
jgi:hypothetical protein